MVSKQAGKHLEGIQSEPCPVGACLLCYSIYRAIKQQYGPSKGKKRQVYRAF